ncbi:MAG: PspC domain-containing protein [Williamsia sp.]|nr:PspC domain-containing protein [Williamsia sp.]
MKKIININFQGRIVPIEETAYEILMQYVESLRRYFANEEGRDEIINDIESRIGELFSNRLKATSVITDEDVNTVIASIGRPEDFDEAEGTQSAGSSTAAGGNQYSYQQQNGTRSRRLYRSANDKILGGVAAGLANYFGIDPAITRVLFVLFFFIGGGGLLIYIILWIVLPIHNLATNIRKRLYRNPENKMVGGVAAGIAAYFNIEVWIPRLIFLSPFILGVLKGILHRSIGHDFDDFLFNGLGGTIFMTYIVLWIVLPEANSSTEKLEMRGERVDLETIKKTVKEDLENLRGKAATMGGELKERAQAIGADLKSTSQNFATEAGPVVRRSASGIGHVLGILFKAFFLFIAGAIAFGLIMVLITLLFGGIGAFPFKDFVLDGFGENLLAWLTLLLFLGVPIIALLTWLIRRITGVRSRKNYLGYAFGSLWIIGLVSAILLAVSIARDFRSRTSVREEIFVSQPPTGKLLVKVSDSRVKYYDSDWFGFDDEDLPFFSKNQDSILINTVRVRVRKSPDSLYHAYGVKISSGSNPGLAENLANRISFRVAQNDSLLYLPKGFTITRNDKFRNQQFLLTIEVPVGKRVEVDRSVDGYGWFTINVNRRRNWNTEWEEWDGAYGYNTNKEYTMTQDGLKETAELDRPRRDNKDDEGEGNNEEDNQNNDNRGYRYKNNRGEKRDSSAVKPDSARQVVYSTANEDTQNQEAGKKSGGKHHAAVYTVVLMNP